MFKVVSLMQILCNMWFSNKSQYLSNAETLCIQGKTGCNIRPNCWLQYSIDFTPNLKLWDYNISCVLVNEVLKRRPLQWIDSNHFWYSTLETLKVDILCKAVSGKIGCNIGAHCCTKWDYNIPLVCCNIERDHIIHPLAK